MGWQPIETCPRDGTIVILTDGFWVHPGWYNAAESEWPWRFLDDSKMEPAGCCDREDDERIATNAGKASWATRWQPLPAPPEVGT